MSAPKVLLATLFILAVPIYASRIENEQAVIQAALSLYIEQKCGSGWVDLTTIVLDTSVQPYYGHERSMPRSPLGIIPADLVKELYYSPEGTQVHLPDQLYFPFRYVGSDEIDEFKTFSEHNGRMYFDWKKFEERNVRGGVIQFSTPVFGPEFASAVIYMSHSCGRLCGTGSLLYLEKKRAFWTVAHALPLWVS